MTVEFQTLTFWWNREARQFELDEPETLTGEFIDRHFVTMYLAGKGWTQLTTLKLQPDSDRPGVTDLWCRNPAEATT